MRTSAPAASDEARLPLPGEALTRHAVTVITAAIVVMTFAFSLGNVTRLCLDLGITAWIAWLVGPGRRPQRHRAAHRDTLPVAARLHATIQLAKLRRMLRFCGILTLALNTSGALWPPAVRNGPGRCGRTGAPDRLERGRPVAAASGLRGLLARRPGHDRKPAREPRGSR